MTKERNTRKEPKKKAAMTLKEKRAAKRDKKGGESHLLIPQK